MGVYENLGVRPTINAWGTITRIGGSRMNALVLQAMTEASGSFVNMDALHESAGRSIAKSLGVEAACITSGAAAGLAIAAAACMVKDDPAKILQLPETTSMRNEALVLKSHRILYDQSLRLSGAVFAEVGVTSSVSLEQLEAAITDRSAMFLYVAEAKDLRGSLPLADIAAVLNKYDIPIIVDAAAELPPVSNLTKFLEDGADFVVFSGGKEIRGPQSSGLIVGKEEMIRWCSANSFPNYGVGRAMKLDKETIVGLVTAVELFMQRDYEAIFLDWEDTVTTLVSALADHPFLTVRRGFPSEPGVQPADVPRAYITPLGVSAIELQRRLRESTPSVAAGIEGVELALNPQCLETDEVAPLIAAVLAAMN